MRQFLVAQWRVFCFENIALSCELVCLIKFSCVTFQAWPNKDLSPMPLGAGILSLEGRSIPGARGSGNSLLSKYHRITGESRTLVFCVHGEFQLPMIFERDIKSVSGAETKHERASQL
jgi:hypothetical protein